MLSSLRLRVRIVLVRPPVPHCGALRNPLVDHGPAWNCAQTRKLFAGSCIREVS